MKWSDLPLNPTSKPLRQFAAAWLIFFCALGLHQWLSKGQAERGLVLGFVAGVVGIMGLIKPRSIRWLFVACMVGAFPIGWVVSQLTLLFLFYLVMTPMAFFLRLRGRDLLCRKPAPGRASFWIAKTTPSDVRSYFRQY